MRTGGTVGALDSSFEDILPDVVASLGVVADDPRLFVVHGHRLNDVRASDLVASRPHQLSVVANSALAAVEWEQVSAGSQLVLRVPHLDGLAAEFRRRSPRSTCAPSHVLSDAVV